MTELGIERPIVGLIHTILTKEAGTKVVAYADDVVILMQGKFPQTLCNLMETTLSSLSRPILLYGIIVWWHSLEKNCNLKNLHKIQRSAELCISGALRTTATEALNTILDLEPLDLLAKRWASATALRLREASAWSTGSSGHSRILTNQRYIPHRTDYVLPTVNFEKTYKVLIPTRSEWDHLPHQIENAVNIYTDGSKLNLQTGGGVFSPELDIKVSFRLPEYYIFIFSDSQAALRALDSYSTNSLTISECRKSLNEMATHLRISLIWVPGHRNIEGNCIADELARQGTTTDILRDKDTVGMPIATCKLLLKQRLYTLSNNHWNTISTCHTSRLTWGHTRAG
ncbi:uncharacterized protein [Drosophila takahashii]|uniref:uncharacterized protein n=1 Tax=Drosophila takahashii TaxID=29030 RepID=UPI001CF915DA|nr:uncharacterized protein LOC123002437 [Drosophila takahashii]